MYMSVHNSINVSKVICKCKAPIPLLPIANLFRLPRHLSLPSGAPTPKEKTYHPEDMTELLVKVALNKQ